MLQRGLPLILIKHGVGEQNNLLKNWKFQGEGGTKIPPGTEIPRGWGRRKKPSMRGVWLFSGTTQYATWSPRFVDSTVCLFEAQCQWIFLFCVVWSTRGDREGHWGRWLWYVIVTKVIFSFRKSVFRDVRTDYNLDLMILVKLKKQISMIMVDLS